MTAWLTQHIGTILIITEVSDRFDVTIPAEEIMPENFDSAEALWALICRLDED